MGKIGIVLTAKDADAVIQAARVECSRLEAAVKKITADPANLWGLGNRGMLREGFIADITIFDEAIVDRGVEYFVQDVPGDGYRYVRDAHGIHSVVIGGALAYDKVNGYHEAHRGQIIG